MPSVATPPPFASERPAASAAKFPPGRHDAKLLAAQAEELRRELELRKRLLGEVELVIATFERVLPLFEKRSPVFAAYAEELRTLRRQLAEFKAAEQTVQQAPDSALFPGWDLPGEAMRRNARLVSANYAYFRLFPLYQILLRNLQPLLIRIAESDPAIRPRLTQAVNAMEASWQKILPLAPALVVRRVAFDDPPPTADSINAAFGLWRQVVEKNPTQPFLRSLTPHASQPGKTRIAYVSVGGLGDALLQTPCVAEIRRRLEPCEVVLIHSRAVVHPIFANNPMVEATAYADERQIAELPDALKQLGIFDVVFESRFLIWGELCCQSRLTSPAIVNWVQETQRLVTTFAPCIDRFPHYANLFARIVSPRMVLDVHGLSTGLPVSVDSPLRFCPAEADVTITEELGLVDGAYVTVHDGFDEGFANMAGVPRCTKQLPVEKWRTLILALRHQGLRVVQVGGPKEPLLPGVEVDLRGKTSLSQLCFVLKGAAVHLDTEGGIVHLARAVHKRSIVFFGPTSVTFWGYPQNINLCSEEYADHWWIKCDWMVKSPVAQKRSAMEAFDTSAIPALVAAEIQAARREYHLDLSSVRSVGEAALAPIAWSGTFADLTVQADRLKPGARVAVVGQPATSIAQRLREAGAVAEMFTTGPDSAKTNPVDHASPYNLPANSGVYELVVCELGIDRANGKRRALAELLRLLHVGGRLVWTFTTTPSDDSRKFTVHDAWRLVQEIAGAVECDASASIPSDDDAEMGGLVLTRIA